MRGAHRRVGPAAAGEYAQRVAGRRMVVLEKHQQAAVESRGVVVVECAAGGKRRLLLDAQVILELVADGGEQALQITQFAMPAGMPTRSVSHRLVGKTSEP